jgi:hypothetical protein
MLYLKNTLGGLSRSLTDSALHTFQGPHRWWKLAMYAVMFVLPGGSIAVMLFAWVEHRRGAKTARERAMAPVALPTAAAGSKTATASATAANAQTATGCQARADAPPCRAAAGKQARQTCDQRG